MNNKKSKKQWMKPEVKSVRLFCECTAYVDAI
jgi:hypothetical protein